MAHWRSKPLKSLGFRREARRLLMRGRSPLGGFVLFVQIRWIAAGLVLLFAGASGAADPEAGAPDPADADRERLRQVEQQVEILKRKLEVQDEDALQKASRTATAGAGPDGFFLRSADGKFSIKLRGYTQFDSRWLTKGEDVGDDTFVFRRVRPFVEGTVFEFIDFRVMPDFANSTATLFDAYVNFRYLTQLQVEAGKFKPPLGLERLQSATATMFIERGFPTLLVPSRDLGGMVHGELANGFFTYQIGGFNGVRDGGTQDIDTDDGKDVVGRVFVHPFRPLGNQWLDGFGIGAAGSWGRIDEQAPASFRTIAASGNYFAYRGADTGAAPVFAAVAGEGERIRWSPQAYWYAGPIGVLGEYVVSEQDLHRDLIAGGVTAAKDELRHTAWQAAVSVALTGENASYKGLIPASPFDPFKGTWGAFEIAGRYNEIDFDADSFPVFANPATSATRAQGWTVGLNWYLNRYVRVMANFDHTWFNGGAPNGKDRATEDTILTRLQLSY
jgi:phosphate-selective porin OprO/OprP